MSAIVLSHNSAKHLERCVGSLVQAAMSSISRIDLVVVDNGSTDESPALLRHLAAKHPGIIHPIFLEKNYGTTYPRNLAIAQSTGSNLLICDADAEVSLECIRRLLQVLRDDPECGLVSPQLRYPDGRFQLSTDTFPTVLHKANRLLRLRAIEKSHAPATRLVEVETSISAVWLMPRATYAAVGPLDERIFYSPEDIDYCVRIWLSGRKVLYAPQAIATHDARELSRQKRLNKFFVLHSTGLLYYFQKYSTFFSAGGLRRRILTARARFRESRAER